MNVINNSNSFNDVSAQMSEDPWPHMVIDNYYDPQKLQAVEEEFANHLRYKSSDTWAEFHNISQLLYTTKHPNFKKVFPTAWDCLYSVNPTPFLKCFEKIRPYGESVTVYHELSYISSHLEYPIHYDIEEKVLSFVTYVNSEGTGTLLYDENKNFVKEVEWKPNRSLVFAGETDVTWHSYKTDHRPRLTINTFIEAV